ncbi:hypothetical protein NEIG_00463 [Nematocida sp. ERTm5]|nr:hypothetical protein NEIG_00463 [Nematocida sp. ERTm5]
MLFIPVGVGSNSGNSFEVGELLKRNLQELSINSATNITQEELIQKTSQNIISEEEQMISNNRNTLGNRPNTEKVDEAKAISSTAEKKEEINKNCIISIFDMDSLAVPNILTGGLVIFVCSTTGDGDAPYNMQRFWKELKRKSWNNAFEFYFAVIGLGDSSYPKYNYAAKRLFNRLQQVGGTPLCERCDCDEMDPMGIYSAYIPWIESLKNAILSKYKEIARNIKEMYSSSNSSNKQSLCTGTYLGKKKVSPLSDPKTFQIFGENSMPTIECDQNLNSYGSMYSSVYEYLFAVDKKEYSYTVGDVLAITPENACYQKVSPKIFLDDVNHISRHIDYQSIPMHHHIQMIYQMVEEKKNAQIMCDEELKDLYLDKLKSISESYDLYYSYVLKPKKSFKDVLIDFYIKISVDSQLIRRIHPRYYTISKREGNIYSITAGRIKMKHYKKEILGVCSEYLAHLKEGSSVSVDIKKSQLLVEGDIFVVCTGTGIALGRTIMNEYLMRRLPDVRSLSILFGFRSLFLDCLHLNELLQNKEIEIIVKSQCAYVHNKLSDRNIDVFLAPSRIKELSAFLAAHGKSPDGIRTKNYIDSILEILDRKELEKNIILCGGVRLVKTIPKVLIKIMNRVIKPQSECW